MGDIVQTLRASEQIYLPAMRTIGVVCVLVTVVTVFLILKHSTREMNHYKWMLINQTFWTCNFGLVMGILWVPVPLFPAMASYIRGPLVILGTGGAHIIMCILSGSAVCIANCLLISLIYRYSTVAKLRVYHLMSKRRIIPIIIFSNIFCFLSGFGMNYFANVPFETLKNYTVKNIPEFKEIFETEVVFGYTVEANYFIIVYGGFSLVFFASFAIAATVLIWLLMRSLYAQKSLMSKQKFNFQLSLFLAIAIQFVIPFVFGVLPISIVTVLVQLHVPNVTAICEFCLFCGSLHTVLSNFTTVVIVKPYRKAAIFYFGRFLYLITGRRFSWVQYPSSYSGSKSKVGGGSVFITTTMDNKMKPSPTTTQRTRLDSTAIGRKLECHANPVHHTIPQRKRSDSIVVGRLPESQVNASCPTVIGRLPESHVDPAYSTASQRPSESHINPIFSTALQKMRQNSVVSLRTRLDSIVIGKIQESEINSIHPIMSNRLRLNSTVTEEPEEAEINSNYSSSALKAISKFKSTKITNVVSIPRNH